LLHKPSSLRTEACAELKLDKPGIACSKKLASLQKKRQVAQIFIGVDFVEAMTINERD